MIDAVVQIRKKIVYMDWLERKEHKSYAKAHSRFTNIRVFFQKSLHLSTGMIIFICEVDFHIGGLSFHSKRNLWTSGYAIIINFHALILIH